MIFQGKNILLKASVICDNFKPSKSKEKSLRWQKIEKNKNSERSLKTDY